MPEAHLQIHLIAAARPNFMKIAPLYHELRRRPWAQPIIVHTGQHYDLNMSDAFFTDLNLPEPGIHLGVGSGTHAEQTGNVMIAYGRVLVEARPDLVVVVGDVNSTLAATVASVKLGIPVAHLEAGLRSFDRTMPEEINRLLTDAVADLLWTPSPDGDENLLNEGVAREKIERVGNIMIDSLEMLRPKIEASGAHREFGLEAGTYGIVTLHRPANVDDRDNLEAICRILGSISLKTPLVFPVHPRTKARLEAFGLADVLASEPNITIATPQSYIRFMNLVFNCAIAITDSGGIQEETSYMGIPCLTVRPNTERPITVTQGTNRLTSIGELEDAAKEMIAARRESNRKAPSIEYWDGKSALRVADAIYNRFLTN